jgi:ABC-type antimicrobial peptide transport system permease subunit
MGRVFAISLDAEALLFSFGVATFTAISAGLLPSLFLSKKKNLVSIMSSDSSRGVTTGPQRGRIQSIMISCQVSLACVLLVGVSYDPITVALSILVLCSAALSACLLPALRAARINPITALRE